MGPRVLISGTWYKKTIDAVYEKYKPFYMGINTIGNLEQYSLSAISALYRVPEIVTLERLPGEGESDSRWRTREVRHVGPNTLTPGF